ncbi:hypothetical protein [Sphingobacterium faecium]|uniref:baeRF3 domain-containing protein n=1 Tax=Sphingobacterium faecium TaxID=34087 RepID=UPI002479CF59|nr:hypothetical protein [Sphingobacterium faecium]WGQ14344.1 hypothetical protein QG727_20250 [Sphingobacterium faecium]
MILKEQLQKIANVKSIPCVTISLNTHRTHPDNLTDAVSLKNLLKEAEDRLTSEFDKKKIAPLLEKIQTISAKIDLNYSLDSLHIFLSNDTEEIIKSAWQTSHQGVHIAERFAVRSLIKSNNRSTNYVLMLLSQSGVHIYEAVNDSIIGEITNDDFPFAENTLQVENADQGSNARKVDNMVREYLNHVDKACVKVHHETGLPCIVIATEDNYSKLQQVADIPAAYIGHAAINYNHVAPHEIVKQSWKIIESLQQQERTQAISQMKEAVGTGKVLTDLQEIYQAALDGRGELLIVHNDFAQPVVMLDERTFDLVEDTNHENAVDDIVSNIAWEVLSKKGRVVFTTQEDLADLGEIVLQVRY